MKVNIFGELFSSSGYANHLRQFSSALSKIADVSIECPAPQNWEMMVDDRLGEMIRNNYSDEINILISPPHTWKMNTSNKGKAYIGFLIFEGNKLPLHWVECCNDKDIKQVWCPSSHTKEAAIKGGVDKKKLKIVPHGVDIELFKPLDKLAPDFERMKYDGFTFIFNGGWSQGENDRKDLALALRAYTDIFSYKDDVRFLIHINPVYNNPNWNIQQEVDKLKLNQEKKPKIEFMVNEIPFEALPHFYNLGDCFVCPSRSEGFGLTFLESMACGVPVIAGGYGGQTDFIIDVDKGGDSWLLDNYKFVDSKDRNPIYEGVKWAEYDLEQLKDFMCMVVKLKKKVAQNGLKCVEQAKKFTWKESAKKAMKCLKEI